MEIPLTPAIAFQRFDSPLGQNRITFELNYVRTDQWSMDIFSGQTLLASGLMLEPNSVLTRGRFLEIGELVFMGDDATFENLGINNKLIWIPNEQ